MEFQVVKINDENGNEGTVTLCDNSVKAEDVAQLMWDNALTYDDMLAEGTKDYFIANGLIFYQFEGKYCIDIENVGGDFNTIEEMITFCQTQN